MKKFLKITGLVILIIAALILGLWEFYLEKQDINSEKTVVPEVDYVYTEPEVTYHVPEDMEAIQVDKTQINEDFDHLQLELDRLVDKSHRVNLVLFAHDGLRADTIMFISFDADRQDLDIVSIPRDTYYPVEGYMDTIGKMKINAVYGRGDDKGGSAGMKEAIANLFQVPVHYFVKINYEGAEAIIDSLAPITVNVPRDMLYDDYAAEPELHIDLPAGVHDLDGETAVEYLRWRKNNPDFDDYREGDLQRIKRMQDFARKVIKKAISPKFPSFVKACFNYVYTDLELDLAVSYAVKAIGMPNEQVAFHSLPGTVKGYYYVCDIESLQHLLMDIYTLEEEDQ